MEDFGRNAELGMRRREFLIANLAAGAGAALVPSLAFAGSDAPADATGCVDGAIIDSTLEGAADLASAIMRRGAPVRTMTVDAIRLWEESIEPQILKRDARFVGLTSAIVAFHFGEMAGRDGHGIVASRDFDPASGIDALAYLVAEADHAGAAALSAPTERPILWVLAPAGPRFRAMS